MNKIVYIPVIIVIAIVVLGPLWVISTNIIGIPQTVTVSFHKKKTSGGNPKSFSRDIIVSCGYYYVKGKQYTAFTDKVVPIGTKFEIKYNPIIPSDYNEIQVLQE